MEIVKIIDLVGRDIKGKLADIRTRVNGEIMYGWEDKPIIVEMEKVCFEFRKIRKTDEKPSRWLYWYWKGYSCGFSGTARSEDWDKYQIALMEKVEVKP